MVAGGSEVLNKRRRAMSRRGLWDLDNPERDGCAKTRPRDEDSFIKGTSKRSKEDQIIYAATKVTSVVKGDISPWR